MESHLTSPELMKNLLYRSFKLAILISAGLASNVSASDSLAGVFIEPEAIKLAPPIFPQSELYKGNSGMVEVNMMIDKKGKVFKPIVVRSTSKKYEVSAINAVKKYIYQPASYNGIATPSQTSMVIRFLWDRETEGVSRFFASKYKKLSKEFDKAEPDLKKVDELFELLGSSKGMTQYALARYSLASLRRAMLASDLQEQIEATRKLLLFDGNVSEGGRMLDAQTFKTVRHSLFFLLVQTQRYADALDLYSTIKKSDKSAASKLTDTVKKIRALIESDKPSAINVSLGKRGYKLEQLFKSSVVLGNIKGEVSSLNFRCDRHYAEMAFQAGAEYRIPSSWGGCMIEIIGTHETSLDLIQL